MKYPTINQKKRYINRELSLLSFQGRVLEEAKDPLNPVLERLRFLAITASNLDEFFMVRVGSLKDQVLNEDSTADFSGLTPEKQLKKISIKAHKLMEELHACYEKTMKEELSEKGVHFLPWSSLTDRDQVFASHYFYQVVFPVLTPFAVDGSRPFPFLFNQSQNFALFVGEKGETDRQFAIVQVPSVLPRFIELPGKNGGFHFLLLEELIRAHLSLLFPGKKLISPGLFRITRNADLNFDEKIAEDLLVEVESKIRHRRKGEVLRLEVSREMKEDILQHLKSSLSLTDREIYRLGTPLDLRYLFSLYETLPLDDLKYPPYEPGYPVCFQGDIFSAIEEKDRFFYHPYDSFQPVIDFIERASTDPSVLAIKQTLYRVSGNSPIIKALKKAADRGKQVTVLVEVKARFDEESNIQWAKDLDEAGCHVIVGLVGLKVHSKMTLVVRKKDHAIQRYVHLGTGNYNDKTAKLYTDMGLLTCNEKLCADVSALFNVITGYSDPPSLYKLSYAPYNLRETFEALIDGEIQSVRSGGKGIILAQMNSLVDPKIIDRLYRASQSGVKITLIVRGICCLRPGVKGLSENIEVHSLLGRYLEHTRIFYFHHEGLGKLFLSSADWMPRNLDRRIETLFPIEDPAIKEKILHILDLLILDKVKRRVLSKDGTYHYATPRNGSAESPMNSSRSPLDAQHRFHKRKGETFNG